MLPGGPIDFCSVSVTSNKSPRRGQREPRRIAGQYEAGRDCAVEYPLKRFRHHLRRPSPESATNRAP